MPDPNTDISDPETTEPLSGEFDEVIESKAEELGYEHDTDEHAVKKKRRLPLWPFLVLLGVFLGFGAAFAASYYTRPAPYDPAPLRADMERQIAALEGEVEALRSRPAPRMPRVDLSPLEARIDALENRPAPELPEPAIDEDLVARLEVLKADGFDVAPAPDLSPLQSEMDTANSEIESLSQAIEALIIRVEALETRPFADASSATALTDRAVVSLNPDALPTFPSEILRSGAEARRGGGLLAKHFRVRSEDDPLNLIEAIEADLALERYRPALATFDRLPVEIQNLARGWRAEMERALNPEPPSGAKTSTNSEQP